jgi:hypothetical protein
MIGVFAGPDARRFAWVLAVLTLLGGLSFPASAQDRVNLQFDLNNLLLLLSGALVFWMHAGFACLEAGLTQAKNTVNILAKNVAVVAVSGVAYFIVGFNLMYPEEFNWIGNGVWDSPGLDSVPNRPPTTGITRSSRISSSKRYSPRPRPPLSPARWRSAFNIVPS